MNKSILLGTASVALAFGMLAAGILIGKPAVEVAQAQTQSDSMAAGAPLDRKAVETIIRDYLLANPELIEEAQVALEEKKREELRLASLQVISDDKQDIFQSSYDGVVGNPNGKITIVEFYDYNCGYCKRAQDDMLALTAADPDLRFVLKEFPILGPDSQRAHIVSQAFHRLMPEKYGEFHNQLLGARARATEESAIKIAVSLGVDEAKLRETMKDPSITEVFGKTYDLANKLQITGTPSYVVGNEVVFGALGKDVLSQKIASAKEACTADASC
jgi:protein-disulfide isomerase